MQYNGFDIKAFEQEPGKWCAKIVRANARPLKINDRKLREFVTSVYLSSAVDAMTRAMEAVDAALLFRDTKRKRKTELHWRVLLRTGEISGRYRP
jgi:hypothetical protein